MTPRPTPLDARVDPLDYLFSLEAFGVKFGLDNITQLCAALGRPQDSFRSILIAGTNGKGSVTAFVDRALRAAGHRVARYTSPHLVALRERFVVNGHPVSDAALRDVAAHVRAAVDGLLHEGSISAHPTFFEVTTAIAFELFRRHNVDIAVVEVGLGGRLDSTNVLHPFLTAITTIELDHQQQLGDSLASIAFEKAGIIKPSVPLVVGRLPPEAARAIADVAAERGAMVLPAFDGIDVASTRVGGVTRLAVRTPEGEYGPLPLALRGAHQVDNAVVAIRLLEQADRLGVRVGPAAVSAGLRDADWPGRLDLRADGQGRELLLDAAHNPAGATRLAAYLREEYPATLPLVFGAMRDKDTTGMLAELLPCVRQLVVTRPPVARAADPDTLARTAAALAPHLRILIEADVASALELAWAAGPTICVAGSIFLVGAVLGRLGERVWAANP